MLNSASESVGSNGRARAVKPAVFSQLVKGDDGQRNTSPAKPRAWAKSQALAVIPNGRLSERWRKPTGTVVKPIDGRRYSQWLPDETPAKYPDVANIASHQHFCERTTGFEPATLTLARWGDVLVLKSIRP